MDIETFLIIAVILGAIFYIFKSQQKERPSHGSVNGWKINWSHGLPDAPTPKGQGWLIDVPQGASLHYVQRYGGSLREGQTLTLRLRVTGQFVAPEFGNPATATIMLQRKGDNGSAAGVFETYRQFSGEMIPLTEGEHSLSVTLNAQSFGGIMGSHDPAAFKAVLDNLESVGVVFGSAGGRGHGVQAPNGGRVELLELSAI